MKPQQFVIAMSCMGCATRGPRRDSARQFFDAKVYPVLAVKCARCHHETATPVGTIEFIAAERELAYAMLESADVRGDCLPRRPLATLRSAQKFDYSPQELNTILEWLALERAGV